MTKRLALGILAAAAAWVAARRRAPREMANVEERCAAIDAFAAAARRA